MKTKQLYFMLTLCGALLMQNVYAQQMYFGIGGGYGFAAAKQELRNDFRSTGTSSAQTYEYTSNPVSLGKGINAGIFAGLMLNENLGAELGISYLMGGKHTTLWEDMVGPTTGSDEYVYKANMLRLVPALRLTAGTGKIRPYMKIGAIIGLAAKVTSEYTDINANSSTVDTYVEVTEYSGGLSWGFHGGLGANYVLSDKLHIFAEIAGNYQNFAPKKGIVTESTLNGADLLSNMTTSQKETEYLDSYSETSGTPFDANQPAKDLKMFMPLSSLGINIGVTIPIGSK